MADILFILAGAGDPTAFGLEPYQWVSVSMLVLIAVMVWKKVPGLITGGLDSKIAEINVCPYFYCQ